MARRRRPPAPSDHLDAVAARLRAADDRVAGCWPGAGVGFMPPPWSALADQLEATGRTVVAAWIVPAALRRRFGIDPHGRVEVTVDGITAVPYPTKETPR